MNFSNVTYNDLSDIGKLQPPGWPDIVPEFEYYIRKKFCCPIKAALNNKTVGVGALIVFNHTAWLAHIIVDSKHRNRGIGSQITEKLISEGNKKSIQTYLLIATEMGLPLYEKIGFKIVSEYQYFKRDKPWRGFKLSSNIYPYENNLDSRIFELDETITGENRRSLIADYLKTTLVYIEDKSLTGIFIPDLGEGTIIATSREAGLELMKVKHSNAEKAVLPIENQTGTDFLLQNGYKLTDTKGTRMILGKTINWKPKQIFSRIGGNFG